jgi:cytidylate kinase
MIRIITIEREFGCGGSEIARSLAKELGWKLWDEILTNEIAKLSDANPDHVRDREERCDPLYYRLFKAFLRGSYEGSLNVRSLKLLDADSIFRNTMQVIERISAEGNSVIVGRGSQHFLRDREDVLRIFLYAAKDEKVRRLIARGESEAKAEELVETVDRERAAFIDKYFHVEWPNRALYHALINTAPGDEVVVRLILHLASAMES